MNHPRSSRSSLIASLALVLPLLLAMCLSVYVVLGWVAGTDPFWTTPDLTLSEATVVRDAGEAVRLIRTGHDPNRAWPVRADLSERREPEMITPLEAAIEIRRLEMFQLLVREGARITSSERPVLIDHARTAGARDIAEFLTTMTATEQ